MKLCVLGKTFSEEETLSYIQKVAEALESAWEEHKLIHCDIKPANIMLDRKNSPKLMDLGISQCSHEQKESELIVGTPFFMSPEQACGQKLDFRSDIFSLGSSMYQMLTGEYPFKGEDITDPMSVIQSVINDPLSMKELKAKGISKPTATLIQKMCSKSPDTRHKDWADCLKNINACIAKYSSNTIIHILIVSFISKYFFSE